ncbi:preprotein translocase subunit SecG [bacterium]|nr:preprotein translocase subunit SecG [bacterium]
MNLLLGLHALFSLSLLTLVLIQTQKEQGIMGLFGQGGSGSSSRGKGQEEVLKGWTRRIAIAFFISSLAIAVFQGYV